MLQPIKHILDKTRIVLASSSPRRKEILGKVGMNFEIIPSTFEENIGLDSSLFDTPYEYAKETAKHKALDVMKQISCERTSPTIVIAADTVVALDGKVYEKPKDKTDAVRMLTELSGTTHYAYTGCVIMFQNNINTVGDMKGEKDYHLHSFHEGTEVQMSEMSADVIQQYVETGEPLDKAGGYGINGLAASLIVGINGDFYNVMGFPLHRFCKELCQMSLDGLIS